MSEVTYRPWSDAPPTEAELGETLVLLWDHHPAPHFCVARIVKTRGEFVMAASVADFRRLFHLGLDPMSPDFWTYYPKGVAKNGI